VQAEVAKADTSLRAARALFGLKLFDECVSRAYYTVFHLMCALLLTEGLEAQSHRGVDHLVNLHFVRTGRLDARHAKAFSRLMQFRLQADYSRAFRFTEEGAAEELGLAEATSTALLGQLRAEGWVTG
jgi:uncharacterized protein (UPF0332 family)